MTIPELRTKCKEYIAKMPRDILIVTIIIVTALASFGFGYLAGQDEATAARCSFTSSDAAY